MKSDSYGGIWNGLGSSGTGTGTETGLVSRIDVIGLFVDPGTETYVSESDRCDRTRNGSGTFSAWLEPSLLGWNR